MDMVVIMCSWIKPSVYGFRSCLQKRTWPSTSFLPKVACPVPPYPISSTAPIRQWSCESSTKCARDLKLASMNFSALPFLMKQIWNHNTICIGYRPIGRYPFLVSRDSLCKERYYAKKQGKTTWFSRGCPASSLHKNHLPRAFSHSRVSVFVTQDGVAGGITKECFSKARRWVSILALA